MAKDASFESAAPAPDLIKVVLLKPHTDAGIDHPEGATIEVNKWTRDYLVKAGIVAA